MLENIMEKRVLFYIMVAITVLGLIGKLIAQITGIHMTKEAENIQKSDHGLLKLIKAKYEHANMASDRIKNVEIFVDKYLHRYRIMGLSIYTWQNIEIKCMWLMIGIGAFQAAFYYLHEGMGQQTINTLVWTGLLGTLLLLVHAIFGSKRRIVAVRTYIVDYLENVCAHRYAKMKVETEKEEEESQPQVEQMQQEVALAVEKEEEQDKAAIQKEAQEKRISQEIRIREILEEFLA